MLFVQHGTFEMNMLTIAEQQNRDGKGCSLNMYHNGTLYTTCIIMVHYTQHAS